jgi:hypothetical protein
MSPLFFIFFALLTAAALTVSILTFLYTGHVQDQLLINSQLKAGESHAREQEQIVALAEPGPPGPPGDPGLPGYDGIAASHRPIDHDYLPWRTNGRVLVNFHAECHGFYVPGSPSGELVVTGEMQVSNPPHGQAKMLRAVRVWIPHRHELAQEFAQEFALGEDGWKHHVDLLQHDWAVNPHHVYSGYRSADSLNNSNGALRDEQENFDVYVVDPWNEQDVFNDFFENDLRPFDHRGDHWGNGDNWGHGGHGHHGGHIAESIVDCESTILEFHIIVGQGDEQVGMTPFEVVLPLTSRWDAWNRTHHTCDRAEYAAHEGDLWREY